MNPDYTTSIYYQPRKAEFLKVLLGGIVTSVLGVLLAWAVSTYVIGQLICGDADGGLCAQPYTLGYNIFLIIGALAATGWLAYSRIFRPALITLPTVIILWSLPVIFEGILESGMLGFAAVSVLLTSLAYLVFYWLVRIRSFLIVLFLWIMITVGLRVLLVA